MNHSFNIRNHSGKTTAFFAVLTQSHSQNAAEDRCVVNINTCLDSAPCRPHHPPATCCPAPSHSNPPSYRFRILTTTSMTNVLPSFADDLTHGLRPLDFSSLLSYTQDSIPVTNSPALWPSNLLTSPNCTTSNQLSTQISVDPFISDFALQKARDEPMSIEFPTVKTLEPLWPAAVGEALEAATAEASAATTLTFSGSHSITSPDNVMKPILPTPVAETQGETVVSERPSKGITTSTKTVVKRVEKKTRETMSSIDKAAERRRKNRESSSRCYYNRKRIIEKLDKKISTEKTKLTNLYDRALELRHENARLKKDVVTRGIPLPIKGRGSAGRGVGVAMAGYMQMMQRGAYRSRS